MKIDHYIYDRAKEIVSKEANLQTYLQTCFRARLCPKCGKSGLEKYINNEGFVEGIDYECPHCDWEWSNLTEEEQKDIMEINHNIYRKARSRIGKESKLQKYIDTCVKAKLCPKCGEKDLKLYIIGEDFDCECFNCNWCYDEE